MLNNVSYNYYQHWVLTHFFIIRSTNYQIYLSTYHPSIHPSIHVRHSVNLCQLLNLDAPILLKFPFLQEAQSCVSSLLIQHWNSRRLSRQGLTQGMLISRRLKGEWKVIISLVQICWFEEQLNNSLGPLKCIDQILLFEKHFTLK